MKYNTLRIKQIARLKRCPFWRRIFPSGFSPRGLSLCLALILLSCGITFPTLAATPADSTIFDHLDTGFPLEGQHAELACESCHQGGTFETLPTQCDRCHDGVFALGKKPTHIPTNASCDACHTPEGFSITAQIQFDHSSVAAQPCENCHNGTLASGKPVNHLLTTNNCAACHNYTAWLPAIQPFNHSETLGSCASSGCHDGNGLGQGKPLGHPLTSNNCEGCHRYPQWNVLNSPFDHSGVLEPSCNKSSCHSVADRPADHPPVITDRCEQCHTSMGSWVVDPGFDHSLTTQMNCMSSHCHSEADKRAGHPVVLPVDCQTCHATKGQWLPIVIPFDHSLAQQPFCASSGCHSVTDKGNNHPLTSDKCEACHSVGAWTAITLPFEHSEVTITTCITSSCHSLADKVSTHPQTTNACELCHNPGSWAPKIPFDHTQTSDSCTRCHNGSTAPGKDSQHPGTTELCQECHVAGQGWSNLILPFDHSQVTQVNCASAKCHSEADKYKLSGNHPNTSNACEACHRSTTDWLDVAAVTHTFVDGCGSSSCHGTGGSATAKTATHPNTTDQCQGCHAYPTWKPLLSVIDHSQALEACVGCHNGAIATGKGANHPQTSNQCESCHNTTDWLQVANIHSDALNAVNCARAGCHDGSGATGKSASHPRTTNVCEACHTYNVWGNLVQPFAHAQTNELCEVCHNGVVATGKNPVTHFPTNLPCDSCHNENNWHDATLDHSTVANLACASAGCHDGVAGGSTYKSATHPLTSELCDACHLTGRWIPTLNPIDHSQTSAQCSTCHNGSIATGKSANHCQTSLDCDQCHSTNQWRTIPNAASCGSGGGGGLAPPPSGGGGTSPPPSGDNQPPVAMINGPVSGFCNRAYLFDGTQSYDPEGQPLRYSWRIDPAGSGTIANATGAQTNITFSRSGANTITLIVNDQSQDSFPAIYTFTISNMMCR